MLKADHGLLSPHCHNARPGTAKTNGTINIPNFASQNIRGPNQLGPQPSQLLSEIVNAIYSQRIAQEAIHKKPIICAAPLTSETPRTGAPPRPAR